MSLQHLVKKMLKKNKRKSRIKYYDKKAEKKDYIFY